MSVRRGMGSAAPDGQGEKDNGGDRDRRGDGAGKHRMRTRLRADDARVGISRMVMVDRQRRRHVLPRLDTLPGLGDLVVLARYGRLDPRRVLGLVRRS
jgi:hypothetical protein